MHKKNPEINQPDSFHVNILVCVYVASIKARAVIHSDLKIEKLMQ